jgi:putative hydrolase of the HAD superfamily
VVVIHWVVLDAMGVVYPVADDTNDLLVPFIRERNQAISRESINEIYRRTSLGEISSRRFWEEVGLGDRFPAIETTYLDDCVVVDPAFGPVAMRLARQFRLGLLSNDVAEWSRYLRTRRGLAFDATTISGDVHCRKPSLEIYRHFLRASGAHADQCVFVDDRDANLAAAREAGFRTIHFDRDDSAGAVRETAGNNAGDGGGAGEPGGFEPDARIGGFGELEAAIGRIEALR